MNNVDDDTIIMIMIMNGDRKLTKYTPFIHSIIQSFNGLNSLSILISIIECEWWIDSLRYSTFICILNQLSLIHWLSDWVIDWLNEWFVWYWRIRHSIQISNCETTIDITTNYNYQVSNTSDLIPLLSNW